MHQEYRGTNPSATPLRLWGGIEGSAVRVGERWRDQVRETGHHDRLDDLDRVAALGIRTLRYPVLWERLAPGPLHCGWAWYDERMARMQALGIDPIVGLVHHGSGPPGTNPLAVDWACGVARHAAEVADRYPFLTDWTPVNEPLTTARFSTTYGYWHPHHGGDGAFETMVLNQCHAVMLSMREIRKRNPAARLIQTEDLGRIYATPPLARQAAFENERRWLSLDLLCGLVNPNHPWWDRLLAVGGDRRLLDELRSGETAPDIVGINHYVTSDRFLDHRTALYPPHLHGGNGHQSYVDIEAVRAELPTASLGFEARLREAWRRYRRPIAATEAHLGCREEEEQVRWLVETWQAAEALRAEGADVVAVTAWSLFGSVDWDSLLRAQAGHYEPGVWDVRDHPPRPTMLAGAAEALARRGRYDHPCLSEQGWWRRERSRGRTALSA